MSASESQATAPAADTVDARALIERLRPLVAAENLLFEEEDLRPYECDGLSAYRSIVPQAFERLERNGFLCVEIGAVQAEAVSALMAMAGFSLDNRVPSQRRDLGGHVRVVTGQKT